MGIILNILHWWFFDFYLTTAIFCFLLIVFTYITRTNEIIDNIGYFTNSLPENSALARALKRSFEKIENYGSFGFIERFYFIRAGLKAFVPFFRFFYTFYIVSLGFIDLKDKISKEEIQERFKEIEEKEHNKRLKKAHNNYLKNKDAVNEAFQSLKPTTQKAISKMDHDDFQSCLKFLDKQSQEFKTKHSEDEYEDI